MATEKAARHERPEALGRERVKVDEQDSRLLDAMMDADMPRERIRKRLNSIRQMRASMGERVASLNETAPSGKRYMVGAMEHCGNRRPRVERLVSAWNQGTRGDTDPEGETDDPLIDASVEPKQRPRTRLTDEEVDAMRTARAQGISVIALAKQFGVHRGTVWAKSR